LKIKYNKYIKYILVFISVLILLLSGYYNYSQPSGIEKFLKEPLQNSDKEIKVSGYVISVGNDFYTIADPTTGYYIRVHNTQTKWRAEDYVALKGIFVKEGYVELSYGELIWDKNIKLILSAVGFVFVLILIVKDRKKFKVSF
jgi:hypothetical protein